MITLLILGVLINTPIRQNISYPPIQRTNEIRQNILDKRAEANRIAQEEAKQATIAAIQAQEALNAAQISKPSSSFIVSGCGDNIYANYIYMHESGCRLNATNAGGCVGIGQACPGSKLYAICPDLNYACQNAFFTSYANSAYGGWAGAYQAWLSKSWW